MEYTFNVNAASTTTVTGRQVRKKANWRNDEAAICRAIAKFEYLPRFKTLVCKEHKYGVQGLYSHLISDKLHGESTKVARAVCAHFAGNECAPWDQVVLPEPNEPPVDLLGTPFPAYVCKEDGCNYVSISRPNIGQHCNESHRWFHSDENPEHWTIDWHQRWFAISGKHRYFAVQLQDDNNNKNNGSSVDNPITVGSESESETDLLRKRQLEKIKTDWDTKQKQHEEELHTLAAELEKADQTGWWKVTNWLRHLAKSNLKHLAYCNRLPDKREEPVLVQVAEVVDLFLEQCVKGLDSLPKQTKRQLRSAKEADLDPRPFSRL